MTKEEIQRLQEENAALRKELENLKNELIRLVSRNLDLSERLEEDLEMRRRTDVARELLNGNIERQRNADLKDDAQLMALIDGCHVCSATRPSTVHQRLTLTTCACSQLCAFCATSHSGVSQLWQKSRALETCAPCNVACRRWSE